jgi:hypothetical protein
MHLSSSQAFNSSRFLNRSRGVKKRSLTSPTWFSTCPFSQPDAGVQATIVETPFTDEDRLYGGLHVVVDAAGAGAFEQGERPVVGVEHHLLRLPRIGPHEQHAAVTEPDMGDLHHHRGTAQQDYLVAPVELVGFAWGKAQRDISRRARLPAFFAPPPGVTPHGIVSAVVAAPAQLFENPDQRQLFTSWFGRVRRQQPVELRCPPPQLWSWLHLPLVLEGGLSGPQHLPDRVPRHLQVAGDLLDRLALDEVLAPNPRNRLHDQHPQPPAPFQSRQRNRPICRGSILDADPPA